MEPPEPGSQLRVRLEHRAQLRTEWIGAIGGEHREPPAVDSPEQLHDPDPPLQCLWRRPDDGSCEELGESLQLDNGRERELG
jgi:hypothetical protein